MHLKEINWNSKQRYWVLIDQTEESGWYFFYLHFKVHKYCHSYSHQLGRKKRYHFLLLGIKFLLNYFYARCRVLTRNKTRSWVSITLSLKWILQYFLFFTIYSLFTNIFIYICIFTYMYIYMQAYRVRVNKYTISMLTL